MSDPMNTNSNAVEALKPCPCCESVDVEFDPMRSYAVLGSHRRTSQEAVVYCNDCGLEIAFDPTDHDASPAYTLEDAENIVKERWNTRGSLTTTEDGLVGELRKVLDAQSINCDWTHDKAVAAFMERNGTAIITALSPSPSGDVVEPIAWAYDRIDYPREGDKRLALSIDDPTPTKRDGDKGITNIRPLFATPQHTTSPDALLREALEPFANAGRMLDKVDPGFPDEGAVMRGTVEAGFIAEARCDNPRAKHLRHAAAVLDQHLQGAKT